MLARRRPYYGWYIIAALAISETVSWGIVYYAFSVFIVPIENEFGWTRAQVTGAFSLSLLMSGLAAPPVGFWLDKYGPRGLMTVGSIVAAVLYVIQSQLTSLIGFYAVWFGLGICMAMVLYEPSFVVAAKWFERRRGAALATITFAAGFASTIFLPLTTWLLQRYGRVNAQLILALILALVTVPLHALVLRRSPEALGLFPDGATEEELRTLPPAPPSSTLKSAMQGRAFWLLSLAFGLSVIAAMGIRIHMIPLLLDRGFSAETAATMTGIIGAMQVAGRLIYAPAGDKLPAKQVVLGLFFMLAVSLVILRYVPSTAGVWAFVLLIGLVHGTLTLARPAMLADFYGSAEYGRISSIMAVTQRLSMTVAPYLIGLLYTLWNNDYNPTIVVMIGVALGAFAVMTQVTMPQHRTAATSV